MGRGGHGPGMGGAGHSHDAEYPDDEWNLYQHLDEEHTTALNVTRREDAKRIFKPHARRFDPEPCLYSDADPEIIVIAHFVSPVTIRRMIVIGGGEDTDKHPNQMICYVNKDGIDFNNLSDFSPVQGFDLPINTNGEAILTTVQAAFTNVHTLTMFFPGNHGGADQTVIQYIGLQGDHTHYRRQPVHTYYELLDAHEDVKTREEYNNRMGV